MTRFVKVQAVLIGRLCIVSFGISAILWVAIALPKFWTEAVVFQAAARIVAGDLYSQSALENLSISVPSTGKSAGRAAAMGPLAVVQLRLTEEEITRGDQSEVNSRLISLDRMISTALTGSPHAPYQWLALYWTESRLNGYNFRYLQYLRMSYDVGPLEGWVALRRNRIALALYAALPHDLKEAALSEFVGLIRPQFFADAAEIFGNSTPNARSALIARLDQIKGSDHQAFMKILNDKGFWEVAAPRGINVTPSRPWR